MRLVKTTAELEPGAATSPLAAAKLALQLLARRYQALTAEIATLDTELDRLTATAAPKLLARFGIGSDSAGALLVAAGGNPARLRSDTAFAMLCGASPLEASSGKVRRHRLNRVATAKPTPRCTGSWSPASATTSRPGTTWPAASARASPGRKPSAA